MPLEAEYSVTATARGLPDGTHLLSASSDDGRTVAIKVLASEHPTLADADRLRNEYEVGSRVDCPGVLRALALGSWNGRPALVLEGFDGAPLDRLLGVPMPLERFLPLAEAIARALGELHAAGVVHRDIKPQNILVGHGSDVVKLAGLGIASLLPAERGRMGRTTLIEGALAFMSPEQTGRMNRAVDHRSDLYSLGVTFFEMLAGQLPFDAKDPLEWIHCHIARRPPPLTSVAHAVPLMVSAIVMKLLSKLADERYQGARGLARDLERCRLALASLGRIDPFSLGADDVPEQFQIPQRLYGRERETRALLSAFAAVVESGVPELLLVEGGAGVGKSRLVHEMEEPIVRARGFFLAGKFDHFKPDIPYSTFVQAFREVVLEVLAESEQRIGAWRQRLQDALGVNAQLIVDVIPPVELVIGKQPPVPELPPLEAQNRFRTVFRQFIGVFARHEHPLTLFLDDLQWADAASLALLQDVMTGPEIRHVFIIGAYRDNEVTPSHPLVFTLNEVRKSATHVSSVVLGPLSNEHLGGLVSDALHCRPEDAAPLADLLRTKTGGNPFFAVQFLTALHDERLIDFDGDAGTWRWDIAKIRAKSFTDNVVELMVDKVKRLAAPTRAALEHLASVGNSAELTTLAMVHGRSEEETRVDLREAVLGGLVLVADDTYRFVHDRIQEATYSLIAEPSRPAAHLRVGRLLLAHVPTDAIEDRVFDIVNQLNRGAALISDASEKEALCRLNFRAGRKAKAAIAYASARSYMATATSLLAPNAWETGYEDTFALHLERSECEYLLGDFERSDDLFSLLLEKARSNADRAKVWILRMQLYQLVGKPVDAVTIMVDALQRMGITFPETDEALAAALEAEQRDVSVNMRGRRIVDLASEPLITDAEVRALISLLVAGMPCAHIGRAKLFPLIVIRALNLLLQHGTTEGSSFAFSAYATLLVAVFGDIPSAFQFSEMAKRLNEKYDHGRSKGGILHVHAHFIHCWRRPFATVLPLLEEVLPACLEVGELVFAGYHAFLSVWLSVESGATLDETLGVSRKYAAVAAESHSQVLSEAIRLEQQFVATMKGLTWERGGFSDGTFDEAAFLASATAANFGTTIGFLHVAKLVACFTYGRYDEALACATRAAPFLNTLMAMPLEATYHFYVALTLAALHPRAAPAQKKLFEERLATELSKLAYWAENCPENYGNRHALAAAEVARIEGRDHDAMRLYEEAIRSAHEHGLVQNEALAFELASAFYRARGFDRFAESYLREARSSYAQWGADGKVTQLDERSPPRDAPASLSPSTTFTARSEQLDLFSIVEALQTISSAIVLDDLVRTLLMIVLEQGGAQRATLLLVDKSARLSVEAEAESGAVVSRLPGAPSRGPLPQGIIDYVWRTNERVLLDDASGRNRFSGDEYIQTNKPRSVLCLPIVRQGATVGLLYLENNLLTRAFTPDRLSVLELLASQAAISLENARLYADLERENAERRSAERAMMLATEALRQSEERFRLLVDGVKDCAIFMLDPEGRIGSWNAGAERLFGFTADEIVGHSGASLYMPDDVSRGGPEHALAMAKARGSSGQDGWRRRKDGSRFFADVVLTALRDERGELRSYSALVRDLTQRLKLEEQVREAQKMEAVGRLAGGVAHDFNNLLAVIYGFVSSGLRRLDAQSPVRGDLAEIQEAARRAADLTRQLLAFASRQRVEPRVFDLNELVLSMDRLLRRTLGDNVELVTIPSSEMDLVEADPGQIEQVILNLAVNARDAMPRGGALTIETSTVEVGADYAGADTGVTSGRFAMLAFSDTGTGIPLEVLEHIFEPFFTTKRSGEGTGLGLATSYGIIKQAGGFIWVYSEPGRGATFKVYLPVSWKSASAPLPAPVSSPISRGETLLLVEDHATLRSISTQGLEALGYAVITAQSGEDAVRTAAAHEGGIDLLLTDVVMPRMSGQELAERLLAARPGLRVLYVSGYTENAILRSGDLSVRSGVHFLSKPFTPDQLARKIREVLDAPLVVVA